MEKPTFPMRINKYLAWKKYATRRAADKLIEKGAVFINGRKAVIGEKITAKDIVEVRKKEKTRSYRYFAYNKPIGIVTHSPQHKEQDIVGSIDLKGVFPLGRLDKASHGLILLTDDGRATDALLNPKFAHEKEYLVTTVQKLRPSFKKHMEKGVDIGDYITKPCHVTIVDDHTFKIILTEGKKHQIRRMCVALHTDVQDLQRVRIMNVLLGNLHLNAYRDITGDELKLFLEGLGL